MITTMDSYAIDFAIIARRKANNDYHRPQKCE